MIIESLLNKEGVADGIGHRLENSPQITVLVRSNGAPPCEGGGRSRETRRGPRKPLEQTTVARARVRVGTGDLLGTGFGDVPPPPLQGCEVSVLPTTGSPESHERTIRARAKRASARAESMAKGWRQTLAACGPRRVRSEFDRSERAVSRAEGISVDSIWTDVAARSGRPSRARAGLRGGSTRHPSAPAHPSSYGSAR